MSAKQTGLVWELALPHNEAWVLMAMADHADHEGISEAPMSPQPGQNVTAARTQLCHPNRQGRESSEPSAPPPSDAPPNPRPPRVAGPPPDGENGEVWKTSGGDRRTDGDANRTA